MDVTQVEAADRPGSRVSGGRDKMQQLERLFRSLGPASSVESHSDFFNWLQGEISKFLPHEALLVAWGNFRAGELDFDVTSSVPGLNTQSAYCFPDLKPLIVSFYKEALAEKAGWFVKQTSSGNESGSFHPDAGFSLQEFTKVEMRSMLAYVMHDERGSDDCLYMFFSKQPKIDIDSMTLGFLMPHIDSALRRVKCFKDLAWAGNESPDLQNERLSERELQVMKWVTEGKSNSEIGVILGISHNTVKNHLKRVFAKMEVTARSQAVRIYLQNNFEAG